MYVRSLPTSGRVAKWHRRNSVPEDTPGHHFTVCHTAIHEQWTSTLEIPKGERLCRKCFPGTETFEPLLLQICCGLTMRSAIFSGVRIWECVHRGHLRFQSMTTNTVVSYEDLQWRS